MSKWKDLSVAVITEVLREKKVAIWDVPRLPTAEKELLRKLISEAYPFGERANHPYKMWLKTVKQVMGVDNKVVKETDTNQLDLF